MSVVHENEVSSLNSSLVLASNMPSSSGSGSFKFNYYGTMEGVFSLAYEELTHEGETKRYVPATALCEEVGVKPRTHTQRPGIRAKLHGKGQAQMLWTLATCQAMLEDLTLPMSFSRLSPDSQRRVRWFYQNFSNLWLAQENPTVERAIADIFETVNLSVGEQALRRDAVIHGLSADHVDYTATVGYIEIVEEVKTLPTRYSKSKEPTIYHSKHNIKLDVANYKAGQLFKLMPLSRFELLQPDHRISERRIDYLNVHRVSEDGKSLEYIGPTPEKRPWDNQPVAVMR